MNSRSLSSSTSDNELKLAQENRQLRQEVTRLTSTLKEAETLIKVAPAFFGFLTLDGVVLSINQLALQAVEAMPEQVIGQRFWETPFWTNLQTSAETIHRAVKATAKGQRAHFDLEYWSIRHGVGSKRWVSLDISPVRNDLGAIVRLSATGVDITDQKLAEQQVVDILENMNDGFIALDAEWRILRVNANQERISQIKRADQIGKHFLKTFLPNESDRQSKYWIEFHRAMQDRVSVDFEEYYAPLHLWTSVNAYPTPGGGIAIFYRDISNQRTAAEQAESERQKLETIHTDAPATGLAPAGENAFAFIERVIHSEDRDKGKRQLEAALKKHSLPLHEARLQTATGDARWLLIRGKASERTDHSAGFLSGILLDVTEQKLASDRIRESEARFRQLADAMPEIVYSADEEGNVNYYNRRWYERTGATPGTSGDESWMPYLQPDEVALVQESWSRSVRTGQPYIFEFHLRDAATNQYRWHISRGAPIRDDSGKITQWFGTITDIHEVKLAQEELARSNEELARFAFVASHDLKEPLRVVANYVQLLKMRYGSHLDDNADRYIEYVVNGVKRMYLLINDVLNFSRIGTTVEHFEKTDLNLTLKAALSNLEASLAESDSKVVAHALPHLVVEPVLFLQLFQNLVSNAVKYRGKERPPHIEISAKKKETSWLFSVSDNGIGIESQYFEKIFALFHRLHGKDQYSGTGIGLATCKKIVEKHEGKIWVESTPGVGSTFYFEIPEGIEQEVPSQVFTRPE